MLRFNEINLSQVGAGTPEKSEFVTQEGAKMSNWKTPIVGPKDTKGRLKIEYPVVTSRGISVKENSGTDRNGHPRVETLTVMMQFKYFTEGRDPTDELVVQRALLDEATGDLASFVKSGQKDKANDAKRSVSEISKEIRRLEELASFKQFIDDLMLRLAITHHPHAGKYGIRKSVATNITEARDFIRDNLLAFTYDENTFEMDTSRDPVFWADLTHGRDEKSGKEYSIKFGRPEMVQDPKDPSKKRVRLIPIDWKDLVDVEFDYIPVVHFTHSNAKPGAGSAANVKGRVVSAIITDIREKTYGDHAQSSTFSRLVENDNDFGADFSQRMASLGITLTAPTPTTTPSTTTTTTTTSDKTATQSNDTELTDSKSEEKKETLEDVGDDLPEFPDSLLPSGDYDLPGIDD
uniref:Uncharacterized protein n=1 Tax=Pithovirus LCPAC101 TaxID=2506586 RepID=A0A481Z2B2_9VIRU|nr:MAG: hypothetical protein LCPAC101_01700 [Pithovirus LCPAC101]